MNPGAEEIWYDGLDRNCDGGSDFDQDGDGHDALALDSGDDCDDLRAEVHPGAEEVWYNDLDDDCGGDNDNDRDADGYWAATRGGPDCDDENARVFPGQTLWFAVDRGDGSFDYNCSGRDEGRWTHTWDDGSDFCVVPGWYRSTPACGESGQTVQYCGSGTGTFGTRTQLCR